MKTPLDGTSPPPLSGEGSVGTRRFRHKKRGTTYTLIGEAQVQCPADSPLTEYEVVTVYRAEVDALDNESGLWVRRKSEFEDGRFEALSPAPLPAQTDCGSATGTDDDALPGTADDWRKELRRVVGGTFGSAPLCATNAPRESATDHKCFECGADLTVVCLRCNPLWGVPERSAPLPAQQPKEEG